MLENKLKELIIEKFGSVRQFSFKINIPYTTVDSILKRGLDNSNVGNVIKICKALDISIDNLLDDKEIVPNVELNESNHEKYKKILKEKGLMDDETISEEDAKKLIDFAIANKDFIIKKKD